jgi:hypothetical protein
VSSSAQRVELWKPRLGQSIPTTDEVRKARMKGIYDEDVNLPIRKSHENPAVIALYEEFLGKPLGHKSHELLHTHYTKRTKYPVCDVSLEQRIEELVK